MYSVDLTHEDLMTVLRALDRDTWRLLDAATSVSGGAAEGWRVEADAVRAVRIKMAQHIIVR